MPDPEWELVVTSRDGATVYTSLASAAATYGSYGPTYGDWGTLYGDPPDVVSAPPATATPVLGFDGQDPIADIGVGRLTLPLADATNTYLEEDRLVHVQVRGTRAVSFKIGAPDQTIIDRDAEGGETAVWQLETLFGILNEGTVDPPGGADSQPASADRLFDWSDPARDNSDFTTPDELGTVTEAQVEYPITPYAIGSSGTEMEFPDTVLVIGPAGYGWNDDAPEGRCYGYIDFDFTVGGYYRVNGTFDNGGEFRIDGKVIQTWNVGFGQAFHVPKFPITDGIHRVAYICENGGTPGGQGPCTTAIEFVLCDAGDNGTLVLATSDAWGIMEFPDHPPGFTIGEILDTVLTENQAFGQLADIDVSFTDSLDTAGDAWSDTWDVSTKSTSSLASFFLKELSETYCDFRMRCPEGGPIVLDAWNHDNRGATPTGVELEQAVNVGQLRIDASPTLATTFLVTHNIGGLLGYHRVTATPVAGHAVKEQGLSLGAAHSVDEVERVALQQLALFGRQRGMTTIVHLTNQDTADADMPGLAYWTGDRITIPTDAALTPGEVRVIAMTVQLDRDTGQLQFTPQLGDLIMPGPARPALALRKMAAPHLGGNARPAQ